MRLFRLAVQRPIATAMAFIAIIVFGVYSYLQLPVDLFPDIEAPVVSVFTVYSGAGAMEVEQNVTDPLESALSTVPDLEEMNSNSVDNTSVITLQFEWDTDMTEASNDVRDALDRARPLMPEDADDPLIQKFDAGAIPVVVYAATATESFYDLENLVDDYIAGPINRTSGVGDVSITGAPQLEVAVTVDPRRLDNYLLDVEQLVQALQQENITVPTGDLRLGDERFNLRVDGEFQDLEEMEDVIVDRRGGERIRLGDVAELRFGPEDEREVSRIFGEPSVTFAVQKQSDANSVEVSDRVRAMMPDLVDELPPDVEVEMIIDTSEFITNSVDNLSSVLFYALIFVVLVVLVFLRQWRATVIVAATIPVSLIVAFIYLSVTGSSLNIISLSSLSIALGMVVDDAIVVLENIMTHLEKGSRPGEAAIYGTGEVGLAILATTLTVVAVFLPLTFLTGMTGEWFGQLGWIVVVTVVTSTLAALTLIPMMASILLKAPKNAGESFSLTESVSGGIEKVLSWTEAVYGGLLRQALRYKKTVVAVAALLFGSSVMIIPVVGTEFMPISDDGQIRVSGEVETSRSLQFTSSVVAELEEEIMEQVPELEMLSSTSGTGRVGMMAGAGMSNEFEIRMDVGEVDERDRSVFEIADWIRDQLDARPEVVRYSAAAGSGASGGGGQDEPIAIDILGHDLEETTAIAAALMEHMEGVEGLRDINSSRGDIRPEFEFELDREQLSHYELTSASVANHLRTYIDGQVATQYRRDGEEYNVVVRYPHEFRDSFDRLEDLSFLTSGGSRVRLSELGTIREYEAPPNIERRDRDRVVTVRADIMDRALSEVMGDITDWIDDYELAPRIDIDIGGDFEEQQEAFQEMGLILLLIIILVYLVMAAQFESLKIPFVIMFSIPFAFTGVFLSSLFTGTPIGVMSFLGGIILVGIVVKNAIVLVDFIRLLQNRGLETVEAIVEGGKSRLRPVLMTSLTTILAMTPLAMTQSEGAEMWQPMAVAVIGGLIFSTAVTLVLVPVIYGFFKNSHGGEKELR